jgi:hypothetical protein
MRSSDQPRDMYTLYYDGVATSVVVAARTTLEEGATPEQAQTRAAACISRDRRRRFSRYTHAAELTAVSSLRVPGALPGASQGVVHQYLFTIAFGFDSACCSSSAVLSLLLYRTCPFAY